MPRSPAASAAVNGELASDSARTLPRNHESLSPPAAACESSHSDGAGPGGDHHATTRLRRGHGVIRARAATGITVPVPVAYWRQAFESSLRLRS